VENLAFAHRANTRSGKSQYSSSAALSCYELNLESVAAGITMDYCPDVPSLQAMFIYVMREDNRI
jgi:hypothetical protein